jgi:hypothetical protein
MKNKAHTVRPNGKIVKEIPVMKTGCTLLVLVFLLSACGGGEGSPTPASPTATASLPTETPNPATPTEMPDPLVAVDLSNPDTYPGWMDYFAYGEFPGVEAQKAMSADMFQLYRNLLVDRGVDGVEAMNDDQVFFMAGQIANQEGWNLPANLDAIRDWSAGPQAASYMTSDDVLEPGIFANTPLVAGSDDIVIENAHTSDEIVANIFGQDTLFQRGMPYFALRADEGILVNLTYNKSAVVFYYRNDGDNYMPLAVEFNGTTTATQKLNLVGGRPPYQAFSASISIPQSIGQDGAISPWSEDILRARLAENPERLGAISYLPGGGNNNALIDGLEFAYRIIISP